MLFALAMSFAAFGQDVAAQNRSDLRCFAVIASILGEADAGADAEARAGLSAGMLYFLGRIEGRSPDYDVDAELSRMLGSEAEMQGLEPDRARCGAILQDRGTFLVEMGRRIQDRAE